MEEIDVSMFWRCAKFGQPQIHLLARQIKIHRNKYGVSRREAEKIFFNSYVVLVI